MFFICMWIMSLFPFSRKFMIFFFHSLSFIKNHYQSRYDLNHIRSLSLSEVFSTMVRKIPSIHRFQIFCCNFIFCMKFVVNLNVNFEKFNWFKWWNRIQKMVTRVRRLLEDRQITMRKRFWLGYGEVSIQSEFFFCLNSIFLQKKFFFRYMKPLLTHSRPTLLDTLPMFLTPVARLLTTTEQLNQVINFISKVWYFLQKKNL